MRELINEILPLVAPKLQSLGFEEGTWERLVGPSTVSCSLSDVAMPCHSLSPAMRKSPLDIATEISSEISDLTSSSIIIFEAFKEEFITHLLV